MQFKTRRQIKQIIALGDRLADEAKRLREDAKCLPCGPERESLLRKAQHTETAAHVDKWLSSPGLQPPT